ncbi:MAG: sulfotransferase [Rhodobacteraceae bacterium]|nr:sulfotransferase [Paracoccaceae bacterium]
MNSPTRPIFLLSPPRAGSTLLQRVLSTHPDIATTSEPWLLLPLLQALTPGGSFANHDQTLLLRALSGFCENLPEGQADLQAAIRDFACRLYAKAGNDAPYFLDKTPRYALTAAALADTFPDAKFVFLFRNPVAITQSMNTTWGGKKWVLYRYYADLFDGMQNLARTARVLGERGHILTYESFLKNPEAEAARLTRYLGLEPLALPLTAPRIAGEMGDPVQAIRIDPHTHKQPRALSGPRARWLRHYLARLGSETLETMGYSLPLLLEELAAAPREKGGAKDMAGMGYGWLYRHLQLPLWRATFRRRRQGRPAIVYK